MTNYMSPADFAAKVDWEGGICDTLDYGLKHTNLDPDDPGAAKLRAAWQELERLYEPVRAQISIVEDLLEVAEGADE